MVECARLASGDPSSEFRFSFTSAGKVAKVIKSLRSTEALGIDGIPVSILKKGSKVLASPIAHLINMSLASGKVPLGFKTGTVIPIYKGKGKRCNDPASYRPVSLLPALSKILELVVKSDLVKHLKEVNGLPNSQFGFRTGRSTTGAISSAHAQWHRARQRGHTLGVMGFDLSSAFDTVDPELLLPKLSKLGITGTPLAWFADYLDEGRQQVDWEGTRSDFIGVRYGVRQGSILGPILFLILMADLPSVLGITEIFLVGYADDVALWASAKNPKEVLALLTKHAENFTRFALERGLVLNAGKTQLMWAGDKNFEKTPVPVNGILVAPGRTIEILGVRVDNKLSFSPHTAALVQATKCRAAMVARLSCHLPR